MMEEFVLNAHIERKKSKCDYDLTECPTPEQVAAIEAKVNSVIEGNMDITIRYVSREEAASIVDLSKLPADASETLRIISHDFADGRWRVRWKIVEK